MKKLSNGQLEVLKRLEQRYHNLRNTFPIGLKKIDDERNAKAKELKETINQIKKGAV